MATRFPRAVGVTGQPRQGTTDVLRDDPAGGVRDEIDRLAEQLQPQLVEWRRHLHAHPELSNQIGRAHV